MLNLFNVLIRLQSRHFTYISEQLVTMTADETKIRLVMYLSLTQHEHNLYICKINKKKQHQQILEIPLQMILMPLEVDIKDG